MSSSSDIEKLFEQFGGDASAYQEIGRENDARTARTRWPLLVTLDLTQPAIPEIGQLREAKPQPPASPAPAAAPHQDDTPKDVAAVTRAKAPLFTRSHRRDIPPVAVAPEKPAMPSGTSWRFGAADQADQRGAQAASGAGQTAGPAQRVDAAAAMTATTGASSESIAPMAAAAAAPAAAPIPPAAASTPTPVVPPLVAPTQIPPATAPAAPLPIAGPASSPFHFRAPPARPVQSGTRGSAPATGPASASTGHLPTTPVAPIAPIPPATAMQFGQPPQATQPQQPPSILGKLFAQISSAPRQPGASAHEAASLQSVFDRLRAAPAHCAPAPASPSGSAAPAAPNSWLANGPRRS